MNIAKRILAATVFVVLLIPVTVFAQTESIPEKVKTEKTENIAEVSPVEDLMREHGILDRLFLVYEEILRRLDKRQELPAQALDKATLIIRNFIQDYHEKLGEKYLFTRFRDAKKLAELVNILEEQHRAGRKLIDNIMSQDKPKGKKGNKRLAESMRQFIRLYRPHKAREDTVLFPALHSIVTAEEYGKLGDEFEGKEHELFGENGFEKIVNETAELEKTLGIYELSQFTAKK